MPRSDPLPAARAIVEALPALLDQATAAGDPLALAVHGMKTALMEARNVINFADRAKVITSTGKLLRRLST